MTWIKCQGCGKARQVRRYGKWCSDVCRMKVKRGGGREAEGTGPLTQQGTRPLAGSNPARSANDDDVTREPVYDEWEHPQPQRSRVAAKPAVRSLHDLLESGEVRIGLR